MKSGCKRRRTKEEIKQEKVEEAMRIREIDEKMERFDRM